MSKIDASQAYSNIWIYFHYFAKKIVYYWFLRDILTFLDLYILFSLFMMYVLYLKRRA